MENTTTTKKFTVLKELEYPKGTAHKVGDVLELNEEQAAKFPEGLIEEVKEEETKEEEEKKEDDAPEKEEEEKGEDTPEEEEEKKEDDASEEEEENKGATFESAKAELTTYGVYMGNALVKTYTLENHGKDFVQLAEKYAERMGEGYEAKEIEVPLEERPDTDVVEIVTTNDQPVRTYSLKVHGKNYKKLADQFIEKYGDRKGYKIKA